MGRFFHGLLRLVSGAVRVSLGILLCVAALCVGSTPD